MLEERDTLYDKLDAGKITKVELHEEMKKSGRILIPHSAVHPIT